MALIRCRDCSAMVSKQAVACPKCGRPLKKPAMFFGCGCGGLLLLGGGILMASVAVTVLTNLPNLNRPDRVEQTVPLARPVAPPLPDPVREGDVMTINRPVGAFVSSIIEGGKYDEMVAAENAGDTNALQRMTDANQIYFLTTGRKVKIVAISPRAVVVMPINNVSGHKPGLIQLEFLTPAK